MEGEEGGLEEENLFPLLTGVCFLSTACTFTILEHDEDDRVTRG